MNTALQTETTPVVTVTLDGYRVDEETGEILGIETPAPQFAIDDQQSAEWVLNKMLQTEATLAAFDQNDAVLHARAVLANAEKMKKPLAKRLEWLHRRFDNELGEFAKTELAGRKERTLKTLYGSISLRTVKGGLRVKDEDAALAIAQAYGWDPCVKITKKFLISGVAELIDEVRAEIMDAVAKREDGYHEAFEIAEPRETVTIRCGLESQ